MHLHRGNGFYPGTGDITDSGRGAGLGFNLNIPWQRGNLTDADYAAAFDLVSSAHRHTPWSLSSMACLQFSFQGLSKCRTLGAQHCGHALEGEDMAFDVGHISRPAFRCWSRSSGPMRPT